MNIKWQYHTLCLQSRHQYLLNFIYNIIKSQNDLEISVTWYLSSYYHGWHVFQHLYLFQMYTVISTPQVYYLDYSSCKRVSPSAKQFIYAMRFMAQTHPINALSLNFMTKIYFISITKLAMKWFCALYQLLWQTRNFTFYILYWYAFVFLKYASCMENIKITWDIHTIF